MNEEKVIYFDPFSGKGYFPNFVSVPYRVLKASEGFNNIEFYFNDHRFSEDLKIFIENSDIKESVKTKCHFLNQDAQQIDVNDILSRCSCAFVFIDSFTQMLANPSYVSKILRRGKSDVALFVNFNELLRFNSIENTSQKQRFIEFFGDSGTFNHAKARIFGNKGLTPEQKIKATLKLYIKKLEETVGKRVHALPVFFRNDKEDSSVNNIIIFLSKFEGGIFKLLEAFARKVPGDGNSEKDLNFYIQNGILNVFENQNPDMDPIIDLKLLDAKEYLQFIPDYGKKPINRTELLEIIRKDFYTENGFLSCVSQKYISAVLQTLEKNNLIICTSSIKRREGTFGDKTVFTKNENN